MLARPERASLQVGVVFFLHKAFRGRSPEVARSAHRAHILLTQTAVSAVRIPGGSPSHVSSLQLASLTLTSVKAPSRSEDIMAATARSRHVYCSK